MHSPFDDLGKPRVEDPKGEEVTGAFSCQEQGCRSTVGTARYIEETKLLTWICGNEHLNKIEGFKING